MARVGRLEDNGTMRVKRQIDLRFEFINNVLFIFPFLVLNIKLIV